MPGTDPVLYVRIDLVDDAAGRPVVLEPAESSLFLPQAPGRAVAQLVPAVQEVLGR